MDSHPWLRLKDVAAQQNVSHEAVRRAAIAGRLPAFQPFGPGTAWCVAPGYEKFLVKFKKTGDQRGNQREPVKQG